jgi:hypothetical protein
MNKCVHHLSTHEWGSILDRCEDQMLFRSWLWGSPLQKIGGNCDDDLLISAQDQLGFQRGAFVRADQGIGSRLEVFEFKFPIFIAQRTVDQVPMHIVEFDGDEFQRRSLVLHHALDDSTLRPCPLPQNEQGKEQASVSDVLGKNFHAAKELKKNTMKVGNVRFKVK